MMERNNGNIEGVSPLLKMYCHETGVGYVMWMTLNDVLQISTMAELTSKGSQLANCITVVSVLPGQVKSRIHTDEETSKRS
jgi:hypothetical protein